MRESWVSFKHPSLLLFLNLVVLIPVLAYSARLFAPREAAKISRQLAPMALFPSPIVFNNKVYLHKRRFDFRFASGVSETRSQDEIVQKSYRLPHRFAGVIVWHLLKHAQSWRKRNAWGVLDLVFCKHADEIGLLDGRRLSGVTYHSSLYPDFTTERSVAVRCGNL